MKYIHDRFGRYHFEDRTNPADIAAVESGKYQGCRIVEIPDNATDIKIEFHLHVSGDCYEEDIFYVKDGKIHVIYGG